MILRSNKIDEIGYFFKHEQDQRMQNQIKSPCKQLKIFSQKCIYMRSIFQFPLGLLPWSLANPLGSLKKTSKSSLLHKLEGKIEPIESIQGPHTLIIDGMAYVQQAKVADKTFGKLAMDLLKRILGVGFRATRIDFVFDDYRQASIKKIERSRRSSGNLLFQSIVPSTPIKQWGLFLSSGKNKNALVKFFSRSGRKRNTEKNLGLKLSLLLVVKEQ